MSTHSIPSTIDSVSDAAEEHSSMVGLQIALSPNGHLYLQHLSPENLQDTALLPQIVAEKIHSFFAAGESIGLLRLGLTHFNHVLPVDFNFWQQFSRLFIAEVCKLHSQPDEKIEKTSLKNNQKTIIQTLARIEAPLTDISNLLYSAPFMRGTEYLSLEVSRQIWDRLKSALATELVAFNGDLSAYLTAYHAAWHQVGRVCFHLAENKNDADYPFAFLATYTTRLSREVQHLPLGRALQEYAGEKNRGLLLALLLPVQKAAENSTFLKTLVDNGNLFKPLAWQVHEAHQFLTDIPLFEMAGVMIRVPNWWNSKKPPRPQISIAVGNQTTVSMGLNTLLDFDMRFALPDGQSLSNAEFKKILNSTQSLVQIKGQWVEVDQDKLQQVLQHWKSVERQVQKEGLSFAEGMRLLAGTTEQRVSAESLATLVDWSSVQEGRWLKQTLSELRQPHHEDQQTQLILQQYCVATLRAYQVLGVHWLYQLYCLKLGGCLADDMGLGKTLQILSLLLLIKHQHPNPPKKLHLLIVPASLLGNWQSEINRFTPNIRYYIAHASANAQKAKPNLSQIDLVITTYAYIQRLSWLKETAWDVIILDEAQAIKNPSAQQTQSIKSLKGEVRLVLTGTPIENRLLDLWSLFDFIAPGLLGSSKAFSGYGKSTTKEGNFYKTIRSLVSPYILRRLKTDKQIISDLPDKTELEAYCSLTQQQAGLYQQTVNELAEKLATQTQGIQRRGMVLAYLLRLKQICNHPNQWLGHGSFASDTSGKFIRLKELAENIALKQEKMLIFTQFREIIAPLHEFLQTIFNEEGLILHGQTPVAERAKRVAAFQQEQGAPYFILSLKAGGTGLNLTQASHVVHFDRWWNPAVENQATDRAFRIGQKKNVLVHKFICRGTIEEKINELIQAKKNLSNEILEQGGETIITEMSDEELLKTVALDIHRAMGEN